MTRFTYAASATTLGIALTLLGVTGLAAPCDEPAAVKSDGQDAAPVESPEQTEPSVPEAKPSLPEARQRAKLMHDLLHDLLHEVHGNYYREDEGLLLPAATFRNVFERFAARQRVSLRWLAVDGEPMNVDHRPQDPFEEEAVRALKAGRSEFEQSTDGEYRYAGPIQLTGDCLKCHVPSRRSTADRRAGLLIRMSVQPK